MVKQISAGEKQAGCVTESGRVYLWESKGKEPVLITSFQNRVQLLDIGYTHSAAITTSGQIYNWKHNSERTLADSAPLPQNSLRNKSITGVACGNDFTIALGRTISTDDMLQQSAQIERKPPHTPRRLLKQIRSQRKRAVTPAPGKRRKWKEDAGLEEYISDVQLGTVGSQQGKQGSYSKRAQLRNSEIIPSSSLKK